MDREAMQIMWNDRYRESETVFGREANQFLVEVAADLKPGTALDLGCGQGRNALWLAEHGFTARVKPSCVEFRSRRCPR